MKPQKGFSLIEILVAVVVLIILIGACSAALIQAQHAMDAVALEANTQQNLRAGMHFITRDLLQAGEGIPPQGIYIPATAAGTSAINRPGTGGVFPGNPTILPPVIPGAGQGALATTVNTANGAILTGGATDIVNILYADNTLVSSGPTPTPLNGLPVTQTAVGSQLCAGAIDPTGLTVTLDPTCFTMPGTPTPITVGNLIMFANANGTALQYVTNVAGQTITFAAGDPAGLNQTGAATGTVASINAANVPTVITRVWMVTYYISTATPAHPQLIRQVNYPGFPAGAEANPAQAIADDIEDLTFSYDVINSSAPAGTYPNGPGDAATPVAPDTPFQIRAVNAALFGRSEYAYNGGGSPTYFRNNLSTHISIRDTAFVNQFNTSSIP
jgi:prepilin-type N-terminal cleavage/methylation domain-containing protein